MTIFGNIMSSIFGAPAAAVPASVSASPPTSAASHAASGVQSAASAARMAKVDVAAVMDNLAEQSDEDLDWRKSIVDLMKLLNLDSSLNARKQLARELHFAGNMKDSAGLNIWLHQQVMIKLAENGGQVPAELKPKSLQS